MSISFTKLGKFFSLYLQIDFQLLALSLLLLTPLWCEHWNTWSHRSSLYYLHFFCILFSSYCSDWLVFASLCSKSLIWFLVSSTLLLFACKFFFISIGVSFVSYRIFFMLLRYSLHSLSILITSVMNSESDRLFICLVLFWSFDLFFHLGHVSLSPPFGSLPVFVSTIR